MSENLGSIIGGPAMAVFKFNDGLFRVGYVDEINDWYGPRNTGFTWDIPMWSERYDKELRAKLLKFPLFTSSEEAMGAAIYFMKPFAFPGIKQGIREVVINEASSP